MAKGIWAGLDVGVETTSICVINDLGELLLETKCATEVAEIHAHLRFLKRRRHAKILLSTLR